MVKRKVGIFDGQISTHSIRTRIVPSPLFVGATTLFFPANRPSPIADKLMLAIGQF